MTSLFLLSLVNRVNKPSTSVGNLTFSKYLQHSQPTRTWQILSTEVLQLPQSSTRTGRVMASRVVESQTLPSSSKVLR